jgi:uncharacterized protein (TIGR02271 family)
MMRHTVVGLFENSENAHRAADSLIDEGISFNNVDISSTEGYREEDVREGKEEDGISRFFNSLFGENTSDYENYSRLASHGRTIVTVHCSTMAEAEKVAEILDNNGAEDVDRKARELSARRGTAEGRSTESIGYSDTMPVIEEEMQVGKKSVETGDVRVRSRIIEKPVEESVRLRTESINVERNPVSRKATAAEMENFKDTTIEASESKEVPIVNKEARVVEEVKLRKEISEKDETIRGSVKRQDVDVDKTKKDRERH